MVYHASPKRQLYLTVVLLLFLFIFSQSGLAQSVESPTYHDGPYVFWFGDKAVVKYVKGDVVVTKTYNSKYDIFIPNSPDISNSGNLVNSIRPVPYPDIVRNVSKVIAISDIHGKFQQMLKVLQGNSVIDSKNHWIYGEGHLVITGDIFDRGDEMTEAMWFVHQLEKEAVENGGMVHFLLGNHELMVMMGDLRYLHEKYVHTSKKLRVKGQDLYGPDSELGRWLRSKNTIVKINDVVYVHAGVSNELISAGYTIPRINEEIRQSIDFPDYKIRFDEKVALLRLTKGPTWFRGYFSRDDSPPEMTIDDVKNSLKVLKAKAIVVGHTPVDHVTVLYDGLVFGIETGMHRGAEGAVLIIENDHVYSANVGGERTLLKTLVKVKE